MVFMIENGLADLGGPDARRMVLDRLGTLYSEAMRAWERSKEPVVRKRTSTDPVTGAAYEQTITSEDRGGDPRFLAQANSALAALRAVLGVDAPSLSASAQVLSLARDPGNELAALDIQPRPVQEIGGDPRALQSERP
jgi:hypothetical protein